MSEVTRDRIRTLRAIGPAPDHLALRLALGRVFDRVGLRPSGIPPGAIVCVRHMRVAAAPRAGPWTAAIGAQLDALVRHAARPFHDSVPAGAAVVFFADEAELLACAARDWRRRAPDAWWWRSLFGTALSDAVVERALLASPAFVPAAIERLSRRQSAAPVIAALSETFCERLGSSIATQFAVPGWTDAGPPDERAPFVADRQRPASVSSQPTTRRVAAVLGRDASSDWAALSPARRALAGLALLLVRAPAVARAPGTVAALRHDDWRRPLADDAPDEMVARPPDRPIGRRTARERPRRPETPPVTRRTPSRDAEMKRQAMPACVSASSEFLSDDPHASAPEARAVDTLEPPPEDARERAPAPLVTSCDAPEAGVLSPALVVESLFGGLVYLVNLALHLELYADFTNPARPGLALPLGDFLALVGERVCGEALLADPVWTLLARLSGRDPETPPGAGLELEDGRDLAAMAGEWASRLAACAAPALRMDTAAALPFLGVRAGRLALSPMRLDVTFDLTTHPLAIRVAGLDRDPGWVPAAGRVIAFHYN
jgi:hypothetical protein